MKPSFALDLRDDQVTLLHRTPRGWHVVGTTRFDAPEMTEALRYMRQSALGLSPRGISTKLIIPNDQILYTRIAAPGPDAAKRKRQVKAALEGMTPYAVEDLVFDIHGSGPEVEVAAVARETLEQAEAFAAEHRFNPVSFVAIPDNGQYLSEPFFGPSAMSPALLSEGEKVDRDGTPVVILAREIAKADPEPEVAPAAPVEKAPASEAGDVAPPAADAAPATPVPTAPETAPAPMPAEPAEAVPAPAAPAAKDRDPAPVAAPVVAPPEPAAPPAAAPVAEPPDPAPAAPQAARPVEPTPTPRQDPAPEAPMALDVQPTPEMMTPAALKRSLDPVKPVVGPVADIEDDLPAAPAEAVRAALAARRAQAAGTPGLGPATTARPSSVRPVGAIDARSMKSKAAPPSAPPGKAQKSVGAMVTAPGIPGIGRKKSAAVPPSAAQVAASPPDTLTAAKPATSSRPLGGLGGRGAPVRGRPRYLGLILTGILLVFLALIAAWSSFFLAGLGSDTATPATSGFAQSATPDAAGTAEVAGDPTAADEAAADGQDEATAAASEQDLGAAAGTDQVAALATSTATQNLADSAETTDAAPAASSEAAEPAPDTAVSTESASAQTASGTTGDEIFLAAVEPPTNLSDPVLMQPAEQAGDVLPQPAAAPPPFGTVYKFDDQGRILPTAEGVITPEGITLVAGKPAKLPPDRPAAIAALAPAPAAATDAADPAGTATTPGAIPLEGAAPAPFPSDPALEGFKPKARPASLVPAAVPAEEEVIDPALVARLASARPRERSAAVAALDTTAAAQVQLASASTAGLDAAAAGSDLAVGVSRLPAARPAELSQAVNAAVNAAIAAPEPDSQASAEPEAQSEPEVETPAPTIPTKASVAKSATEKDALATNKVALIGVFGSDAARYAYVRMSNGALKKVRVGDTLDGGKVLAIATSELRYQKGSKILVLQMPRES